MKILSINIAQPKNMVIARKTIQTGIFKESAGKSVFISKEGLTGDTICNPKYHGGIDQAVYIYGQRDYDWWQKVLDKKLMPGTFGENLTISDLESSDYLIGDKLFIADVILEVTAPRIPCATFATKMADPKFVKKFRNAERPGFYCRVLKEGFISIGAQISVEKFSGPTVSVLEMFREGFEHVKTEQELKRYLAAPIAVRDRRKKEQKLMNLLSR